MMNFKEFVLKEEESENAVRTLLDAQDLIFFFKKDKEIFGANEESRLIFAKLKEKKEKDNKNWQNEASFLATNLSKAVNGEKSKSVFSKKDLNKISIINKEDAFKSLCKEAKKTKKLIQYDKICLGTDKLSNGISNVSISDEG